MAEAKETMQVEKFSPKKVYSKPVITRVQLVAGEAVLATCKFGNELSFGACRTAGDLFCESSARS